MPFGEFASPAAEGRYASNLLREFRTRGSKALQAVPQGETLPARRSASDCREEGVALNQLINVAVAEKLSALRTQAFFRERARHANVPEAIEILNRLGKRNPPGKGDKLPKVESHSSLTSDRKRGKKNT
jgi:hypothetical protein